MIALTLNGAAVELDLPDDFPLLWAIRRQGTLTGTKFGCGIAVCGACTVHVDGAPVRSCSTPIASVAGKSVTTIEGLSDPVAAAVQAAWTSLNVAQCGYCQSGQVMAATALLRSNASPTDDDITAALDGHLCRCGAYPRIRAAVHDAARRLATPASTPTAR
ncbi:MAG: (2Fe-2S)-binding protein [Gemmatimonadaceae bacterium]|nr:(2Fe-2S)-binding protein [Gemmatimonadaceae bacterium]